MFLLDDSTEKPANVSLNKRSLWILALSFLPAAVFTWGIHEYAHYAAGVLLGYDMWISFNQVGLVEGSYDSTTHKLIVTMAGPVVTWIQAIVALMVVKSSQKLWTYSFLFLTFWTRFLASAFSLLFMANDEARASLLVGLPIWVLPLVSTAFAFALTVWGSRHLKVGWKGNLVAYLASSVVTTIVIFSDQLLF